MPCKFIVLQMPEGERAIIFPEDDFYHDEFAVHFSDDFRNVASAGFVEIADNGKLRCFGRSESLEIDSRGEDDEIVISRQMIKRPDK